MALTTTQKTEAYQFFIVAFGAAPGVEYMNQLDDAYGAGYKAAMLLYSPDLEKYKQLYQDEKNKNSLSEKILFGVCCFCIGMAGGAVTTAILK